MNGWPCWWYVKEVVSSHFTNLHLMQNVTKLYSDTSPPSLKHALRKQSEFLNESTCFMGLVLTHMYFIDWWGRETLLLRKTPLKKVLNHDQRKFGIQRGISNLIHHDPMRLEENTFPKFSVKHIQMTRKLSLYVEANCIRGRHHKTSNIWISVHVHILQKLLICTFKGVS